MIQARICLPYLWLNSDQFVSLLELSWLLFVIEFYFYFNIYFSFFQYACIALMSYWYDISDILPWRRIYRIAYPQNSHVPAIFEYPKTKFFDLYPKYPKSKKSNKISEKQDRIFMNTSSWMGKIWVGPEAIGSTVSGSRSFFQTSWIRPVGFGSNV